MCIRDRVKGRISTGRQAELFGQLQGQPAHGFLTAVSYTHLDVYKRQLTRSLTGPEPPTSEQALADIACVLRERVELPAQTRYRLVGVGLSGFAEADGSPAQEDLFSSSSPA